MDVYSTRHPESHNNVNPIYDQPHIDRSSGGGSTTIAGCSMNIIKPLKGIGRKTFFSESVPTIHGSSDSRLP